MFKRWLQQRSAVLLTTLRSMINWGQVVMASQASQGYTLEVMYYLSFLSGFLVHISKSFYDLS
jgi:hypothetical protein